jgi:hypothetical protein
MDKPSNHPTTFLAKEHRLMHTVETKNSLAEANSQKHRSIASAWPWLVWLAILIGSSLVFSVGFACAAPFEAIGAAAAITLARRDALLVSGVIWLINQCVGYGMRGYPWTSHSVAWGIGLGVATLLATVAAGAAYQLRTAIPKAVRFGIAFVAAFLVFEAAIYAVALFFLGGLEDFTIGIVSRVFAINAATFVGLVVVYSLIAEKRFSALASFARSHSAKQVSGHAR